MAAFETLRDLIAVGAEMAAAIGGFAHGAGLRQPLTYAGRRRPIKNTVDSLNRFGIGRGDRVAIVLPNGPEMAAAFLAVAAGVAQAGHGGGRGRPKVAVMDVAGAAVAPGTVGEVVIRGPKVTTGYEANPEANPEASEEGFRDGWFRTGDQDVLDDEG